MDIALQDKNHPWLRANGQDECQISGGTSANQQKAFLRPKTISSQLLRFLNNPLWVVKIIRSGNFRHIVLHDLIQISCPFSPAIGFTVLVARHVIRYITLKSILFQHLIYRCPARL
ncbi:hypothetical protein D3C80_1300150 [compost metagenome]